METKSGIQILSGIKVLYTYVPSLDILEQQTTEIAMVRFINFLIRLNSIACKLELPFFLTIKLTPVWAAKFSGKSVITRLKLPFCTVAREILRCDVHSTT